MPSINHQKYKDGIQVPGYHFIRFFLEIEYDKLYCLKQMSQPKLQLELPTTLNIQHFLQPYKIRQPDVAEPCKNGGSGLLMRLKASEPDGNSYYDQSFVMNFLLIKINSWLAHSSFPNNTFIPVLIRFYNQMRQNYCLKFKSSRNDGQLMAQILLESRAYEWMELGELGEALEGSGLVAATAVQALRQEQWLSKQCYFVIVLGLTSLHGRTNPYIPIVHKDKNHAGQIQFAKRIDSLIHMNPKVQRVNLEIIQDAYSLRCTPQVHGVSLDVLTQLRSAIEGLVNRPQTRYITIKGKRMRNLALRAQSETMLLDQLIMGLNELGHMSFLRSQRILNKHLGKNDIKSSQHYEYLRILLKKYSYLVGQNKILGIPSSIDTMLMKDYQHDVYVHEGTAQTRLSSIIFNLKCLFKLEAMASIEVITNLYPSEDALFMSEDMEAAYSELVGFRNTDSIEYGKAIEKWLKI